MNEMIERAARAMCIAADFNEAGTDFHGPMGKYWRDMARAVITAIREPTEGMVTMGVEANVVDGASRVPAVWRTMIDAILAEDPL